MLLTIIVPVYNTDPERLDHCFASIGNAMSASGVLCECLVVDDGSSARTADFCVRYTASNTSFRYIRKENGGVSSARNEGIRRAAGEYVCFVDSDDTISDKMFAHLSEMAEYDLIYSDLCVVYGEKKEIWHAFDGESRRVTESEVIDHIVRDGKLNGPVCKLIKREFLSKNGILFPEDMITGEDAVFLMKMIENHPNMYYTNDVHYDYFKDTGTASHRLIRHTPVFLRNNKRMYDEMNRMIEGAEMDDIRKEQDRILAAERFVKQLFGICADLARNNALTDEYKQAVSDYIAGIPESYGGRIGSNSRKIRVFYFVIRHKLWGMLGLIAGARDMYLRVRRIS